jgi:hypothetical protein
MDYSTQTVAELKALCKERNIKGVSGKKKADLIALLEPRANAGHAGPDEWSVQLAAGKAQRSLV